MAGIAVTRDELPTTEFRSAAGKTRDGRRMPAIALVIKGIAHETAAKTCGMDRQTLRDWVHRYNAKGLTGSVNRRLTRHPLRLTQDQMTTLAAWVEEGFDAD